MGHKVLIGGTSYEIKGGKTLIDGTVYSITKGRTMIDGTGYDISFSSVSAILNDNDWATIRAVSDAGTGANYWSVGDTKTITINGTVRNTTFSNLSVDAFILGFNHNPTYEGNNRIHFQIGKIVGVSVSLVDAQYGTSASATGYFSMNSSNTNVGGWASSQMRTVILGSNSTPVSPTANTLLSALPSDLRAAMKPCIKYSDNTGGGSDTAGYVTHPTDYLWLLAEFEYHGVRTRANSAEQNYQHQYSYYQAGNSKIKRKYNNAGVACSDWYRSVVSNNSSAFCLSYTDGAAWTNSASTSFGISPAFCV